MEICSIACNIKYCTNYTNKLNQKNLLPPSKKYDTLSVHCIGGLQQWKKIMEFI